jgi:hypothetical protein
MSAELQPKNIQEDDPEILEILKDICFDEAMAAREWLLSNGYRQIRYEMATSIGRALMSNKLPQVRLIEDYFGPGFESKPFGKRDDPNDEGLKGWVFSISGSMPEATMWSGKRPPEQAFAKYENKPLSIDEVIVNSNNEIIKSYPSGWMIYPNRKYFNIYEESEPLTIDKMSELRVILETGLSEVLPGKYPELVGSLGSKELLKNT